MTRAHRRVTPEDAFTNPDYSPADKRLLIIGLMSLADDSGCLRWDARTIRGCVFPYGDVELERIQQLMDELDAEDFAWTYTAVDGKVYAFLPLFPDWQKSRTRQFAPEVPQPAGILFYPALDKANKGSGAYEYPSTRAELNAATTEDSHRKGLIPSQRNEGSEGSELKGPARKPQRDPGSDPQRDPQRDPAVEHAREEAARILGGRVSS